MVHDGIQTHAGYIVTDRFKLARLDDISFIPETDDQAAQAIVSLVFDSAVWQTPPDHESAFEQYVPDSSSAIAALNKER